MRFVLPAPCSARLAAALALAAVLCGCASGPSRQTTRAAPAESRSSARDADGPGANPPADLARLPDAEPRVEAIRSGGPNKPYQALGRDYVPATRDLPFNERGLASWYGRKFHGRRTASGEVYDMYAMTAAHPTLPIPSYARIRNPANGREVLVRVNDRGPFVAGRIVDLSYAAALRLDLLRGVAPVELERITFDEIRTGAWRGGAAAVRVAAVTAPLDATSSDGASPSVGAPAVVAAAPVIAAPTVVAAANGVAAAAVVDVPAQDVAFAAAGPTAPPLAATLASTAPPLVAPAASTATPPATVATASDSRPRAGRAPAEAARGFWVQLGAFRERDGAETFRHRVGADGEAGWLEPLLAIFADAALFRVQAGPYPSRDEAEGAALRARASLGVVPIVVERR
ncbi:MAG TPA: septal ring lytic transglycosylase RlpA family protein [Caldimonas sp.]|nr:septal ring lytic transglycosylase RlpA family protein [Caldimonas sp.]